MRTMIALLLLASPLAAQDVVRFKDRAKMADLEGDVVSLTTKSVQVEVVVDGTRITRTVDTQDVAEIVPANAKKTLDYLKGEEALANGDAATASQRFEKVALDPRAGELLRQTAGVQIVRAQQAAGNDAAVIAAARNLRARKPDGYFVAEAFGAVARTHLAARDAKKAEETIKEFMALGNAQVMLEWIRGAELLNAQLSELQGKHRDALAAYRKHAKDPDVADETSLGELRCLTAIGDWPSLRRKADDVIRQSLAKKSGDARPVIAAYTARGDLDVNDGKPKEALLNYLQGAIVLNRGERSAEHETALARSSMTCARMAAAEKNKDARDAHRGRAVELARELAALYPKSPFRPQMEKAIQESR